ncbi:MAG TPA: hypothetical protein PKX00_25130 [Opitutaceae bacterium]|nr:hypothetical protein [Opitutaceae bacterium]
MLSKFAIDYLSFSHHGNRTFTHLTDDPIEAEDFLMQLLAARARITAIRHDGAAMTAKQFDRMLKVAFVRVVARVSGIGPFRNQGPLRLRRLIRPGLSPSRSVPYGYPL